MSEKFNYREKYSWGFLFLAAVGLAGIIYSFTEPFNIRFKSATILAYPASKYVVIALGLLFVAYAVHRYLKMKAINGSHQAISVDDAGLSFAALKGYGTEPVRINFNDVNELWNKTDSDDGESSILYVNNSKHRYEFFAENFETDILYVQFRTILESRCTNITNRG